VTAVHTGPADPVTHTDSAGQDMTDTANKALRVNIVAGAVGGSGGTSSTDVSGGFTEGSSSFTPSGGVFKDTTADLTAGQIGWFRLTKQRALHANLRDSAGNEVVTATTTPGSGDRGIVVRIAGSAAGGTSSNFGVAFPASGTAAGASDGTNMQPLLVDGSGNLKVAAQTSTPSGTNVIGKVGIDQTTPGTTDSVSVATAQGAGATIGAAADAIVAAGAVGSLSAKLRRATQGLEDLKTLIVLAAGTNVIGKVGIDQTTPGTTDSVSVATAQGAGATIGVTTGVAVTTDSNGTIQQYLRGLAKAFLANVAFVSGRLDVNLGAAPAVITEKADVVTAGTAAWTSGTALDTALSLAVTNYSTAVLSLNPTSTFTGGALIFEVSDDAGTTWYPIQGVRADSFTAETGYTIVASTKRSWQFDVAGYTNIRARVNPVITGTGTANLRLQATRADSEPAVVAGLATGSNLIGKVGVDQTTPGTTDSVTVATGQGAGAVIGATTSEAAVTSDATGTNHQYLRGLVKILADVWDSTNHWLKVNPQPATSGGLSMHSRLLTADTNLTSVKGSAGQVYSIQAFGTGSAPYWLKLYNKASAPVIASDTALIVKRILVPANATAANGSGLTLTLGADFGAAFSTGIAYACVGLQADTDTTATAASGAVNIDYK
jgi:hypothetical protein